MKTFITFFALLPFFVFGKDNFIFENEITPNCLNPITNKGDNYKKIAKLMDISEDEISNNTYLYLNSIDDVLKFKIGKKLSECKDKGEVSKIDSGDGLIYYQELFQNENGSSYGYRFFNVNNISCNSKYPFNESCVGMFKLTEGYWQGGSAKYFNNIAVYGVYKYKDDFVVSPLQRFMGESIKQCIQDKQIKDFTQRANEWLKINPDYQYENILDIPYEELYHPAEDFYEEVKIECQNQ